MTDNFNFLVSVVIPCYNSEKTIQTCIASVLSQSFPILEIIVIDDGSSDRSLEILNSINLSISSQTKIHILTQQNSGPSFARNRGIHMASGNWIAFLDADDLWTQDKVAKQVSSIRNGKDISLCGCGYERKYFSYDIKEVIISFSMLCVKNYFATPSVLVKKSTLLTFSFNINQKYSEDYNLWLQIASEYNCIYVNEVLTMSIENKISFGESGLSSNLWKMEKGELSNFRFLLQNKKISYKEWLMYSTLSILKYFRRILIYALFKLRR